MNLQDLELYFELTKPTRKYHDFNGPYYKKGTEEDLMTKIIELKKSISNGQFDDNSLVIADKETNTLIGEVSWYWKSKETHWLEIGIVIFNENYWGYGIGYKALELWITKLFKDKKEILRIGLSTWSGNERMIRLAEKLGFLREATYRNARIVNGEYFDSVSYGILRDEWN